MATGTKRRPRTVPDVLVPELTAEQPARKVLPTALPGTLDDDGYYVATGPTYRVHCTIFPLPDFYVWYLPSVKYALTREDYWLPGVDDALENECRKMQAYVRRFEGWKFKDITGEVIPEPNPDDWTTYKPICALVGPMGELYRWLTGAGLTEALRASSKNS